MKKLGEDSRVDDAKQIAILKSSKATLKNRLQETKQETKKCNGDLEVLTTKNLQCQSENVANLKLILEFKSNQTKLFSDLDNLKSVDADLAISQQKLEECNANIEAGTKKKLQCEADKKKCENDFEAEVKKNENLRNQTSEYLQSLEESQSTASANEKLVQECEAKLQDKIAEKPESKPESKKNHNSHPKNHSPIKKNHSPKQNRSHRRSPHH